MQKRFLLGLAWLALVILIFVCACRHEGPRIEADLQANTVAALADLNGLDAATDNFTAKVAGRDLSLIGTVRDEQVRQDILGAVGEVRGLRRIDDQLTIRGLDSMAGDTVDGSGAEGSDTTPGSDSSAGASSGVTMAAGDDGRWLLQGRVGSEERRQSWLDAAHRTFGVDLVVDQLEVAEAVIPADSSTTDADTSDSDTVAANNSDSDTGGDSAGAGDAISPAAWMAALAAGPSDAGLYPGDRSVRVEGSVPDEPSAQRFLTAVGDAVPEDWRIDDALQRIGAADASAVQDALVATLQIRNIEFESNSSNITPAGRQIVLRVAQALRSAPDLAVDIEGHTDSSGNAEWNQTLSQQRAEAVAQALQGLGIDAARLQAQGFGSQRPVADNSTQEGRQANRRIEFKVLGGARP